MAGLYSFGERNAFRLHLNEFREDFCRRGRGRSFHVDGPCVMCLAVMLPKNAAGYRLQINTHAPYVCGFA